MLIPVLLMMYFYSMEPTLVGQGGVAQAGEQEEGELQTGHHPIKAPRILITTHNSRVIPSRSSSSKGMGPLIWAPLPRVSGGRQREGPIMVLRDSSGGRAIQI